MIFKNIKIGADPEAFVKVIETGDIISSEGLIGGTKESPNRITEEGHAIQEDNVMVEFNIPPAENINEFKDAINYCKEYLNVLLGYNGYTLEITPSHIIDQNYLNTEQAQTFGCEPDLNAYLKDFNPPVCRQISNLRSCGGHIHIGFDNSEKVSFNNKVLLVKAMDYVLGLESLSLDTDTQRRIMYGSAGSFRIKDYGIEYRTLSNFWIKNDELIEWAYNKTKEAISLVESGFIKTIIKELDTDIEEAINTNSTDKVEKIKEKLKQLKQKI